MPVMMEAITRELDTVAREELGVEIVDVRVKQIDLPPGYGWKEGRGFERQDETAGMMVTNILLGIACIFLLMAALF